MYYLCVKKNVLPNTAPKQFEKKKTYILRKNIISPIYYEREAWHPPNDMREMWRPPNIIRGNMTSPNRKMRHPPNIREHMT